VEVANTLRLIIEILESMLMEAATVLLHEIIEAVRKNPLKLPLLRRILKDPANKPKEAVLLRRTVEADTTKLNHQVQRPLLRRIIKIYLVV
jgi:hypothetical protein